MALLQIYAIEFNDFGVVSTVYKSSSIVLLRRYVEDSVIDACVLLYAPNDDVVSKVEPSVKLCRDWRFITLKREMIPYYELD